MSRKLQAELPDFKTPQKWETKKAALPTTFSSTTPPSASISFSSFSSLPTATNFILQESDQEINSSFYNVDEDNDDEAANDTSFSPSRPFKSLFEMLSRWPALFLLMVCVYLILPGEFERKHETQIEDVTGMKWFPAESYGFHYVGRWLNCTETYGMEMAYEGGYIDIQHNSSRILFTYETVPSGPNLSLVKGTMANFTSMPEYDKDKLKTPIVMIIKHPNYFETVHEFPGRYYKRYNRLAPAGPGYYKLRIFFPTPPGRAFQMIRFRGVYLDEDAVLTPVRKRKLIEVITDTTYLGGVSKPKVTEDQPFLMGLDTLDAKVVLSTMHIWPYMLADFYNVDVRIVGLDGRCLEDECKGMNNLRQRGSEGMITSFFRKRPLTLAGIPETRIPHAFASHPTPDLIITSFGHTTYLSFLLNPPIYPSDPLGTFRQSYTSFLRLLRTAVYPSRIPACRDLPCPPHPTSKIPILVLHPPQTPQISRAITLVTDGITKSIVPDPDNYVFDVRTFDWIPESEKDLIEDVTVSMRGGHPVGDRRLSLKGHWVVAGALRGIVCQWVKEGGCEGLRVRSGWSGDVFDTKKVMERVREGGKVEEGVEKRVAEVMGNRLL